MTDRLAFWLGGILLLLVALDLVMFGSEHIIFLGKKMFDFLEWLAFWR